MNPRTNQAKSFKISKALNIKIEIEDDNKENLHCKTETEYLPAYEEKGKTSKNGSQRQFGRDITNFANNGGHLGNHGSFSTRANTGFVPIFDKVLKKNNPTKSSGLKIDSFKRTVSSSKLTTVPHTVKNSELEKKNANMTNYFRMRKTVSMCIEPGKVTTTVKNNKMILCANKKENSNKDYILPYKENKTLGQDDTVSKSTGITGSKGSVAFMNNNRFLTGLTTDEDWPHEILFFPSTSKLNNQVPYDYLNEIYLNYLNEETDQTRVNIKENYMQIQGDINEQMRAILIDWLIEVHLRFNLKEETLFLTVNLIDRYLSVSTVLRSHLQLLGVSALQIACKYEEIYTPNIRDFVYITDNAYTKEQIFKMEKGILNSLNFNIVFPSSLKFYEVLSIHFEFTRKETLFGHYLLEVFLIDYRMTRYSNSVIACACCYIVMKFFKHSRYSEIYNRSFFNDKEMSTGVIKECARDICFLIDNLDSGSLTAAKRKFASEEFEYVSTLKFT